MKKVLVSGLINIESSIDVHHFPIDYSPIEYAFNGLNSCVSGVGYNVSLALKKLGDQVSLSTFVGNDLFGEFVALIAKKDGLDQRFVISEKTKTAESIVLVDEKGRRKIYCDLKNLQEITYDDAFVNDLIEENYDLYILANINYNRNFLKIAKSKNKLIASDVHCISDLNDAYNRDFMTYSDILFLSNEYIKGNEANFLIEVYKKYNNKIIVVGCGNEGALAYIGAEDRFYYSKAKAPKGIKSTVGAGDALFASFLHFYINGYDVETSLKKATLFAGLKISQNGGSLGFVSEEELDSF